MSDFEDIFAEAEEEPDLPVTMGEEGIPIRARITQLDPIDIVGDRPPERGAWDMLMDFGRSAMDPAGAGVRSREDLRSYLDPGTPHGTTGIDHALQVLTLGTSDEIGGAVDAARAAYDRGELDDWLMGDRTAYERGQAEYRAARDRRRRELEEGGAARPGLATLGTATGLAASVPVTPSLGLGRTGGMAARIAGAGAEGALYGAASGFGSSDAEDIEGMLSDTATGAVTGAVSSSVLRGGAEALGAAAGRAPAVRVEADRARIGSTAGPGPALTDRAVRELAGANPTPERLAEVANTLRRLDIAPAAGTVEDIGRAATSATERLDASRLAQIDDIVNASPDGEGRIPLDDVLGALRGEADRLESSAADRPYARLARDRARDFLETYGLTPDGEIDLDATIPYRTLGDEITRYSDRTNWLDPEMGDIRPPTEIARRMHGALRDVQDTYAEGLLGPEAREALRRTRGDMRVAIGAADMAERGAGRATRRNLFGLGDLSAGNMAASAGASPGYLAAVVGARRALEARGPTLRATGLETVANLLERAPERLGPWAGALRRMMAVAGGIEGAHAALMDQDEGYRSMVEGLEDEGAGADVSPEDFADAWESAEEDDTE